MVAKIAFLAGVLGVGGYVGYKISGHDAAVYPHSAEQLQTILADAVTTLPSHDGTEARIWGTRRSDGGVRLSIQRFNGAATGTCDAMITAVAPEQSRVVVVCEGDAPSDDAIADTTQALRKPMYEEHIASTLGGRPFDKKIVQGKSTAIVMKNMGGMQREALKRADEMQQMQSQSKPDATADWYANSGR